MTLQNIETLVVQAKDGDKASLEVLVRQIQDNVYGLAMRMLWHPEDAEDAAQEILIKVVTHLRNYRGDSAFTTWVYRIAANHLLTTRQRRVERERITFEQFGELLDMGLAEETLSVPAQVDQRLLEEEAKIGCMQGMLVCLDRDHRMTYILGEILELTGKEGAQILGITQAAFRKRLSRARERIRSFMHKKCGLANQANPCRCRRQVGPNIKYGRIHTDKLLFADHPTSSPNSEFVLSRIQELDELERSAALFRSHPNYAAPSALIDSIRNLVESGASQLLSDK
ncbi:MAG: RNA polymerase sigma factor [Chloroflexi bacterium]|nr:MAG: RNA polymerase sigma factor [Chloroflexota bacterium]